ncbi:peptidoglycan recognition protein family protein [Streptomyces axinellae]
MRAKRATSISVVSAALLLPLVCVAPAAGAPGERASRAAEPESATRNNGQGAQGTQKSQSTQGVQSAQGSRSAEGSPGGQSAQGRVAGSTQSLPFGARPATRGAGEKDSGSREIGARSVRPYSLLGVVWEHVSDQLNGHIQVRTRDAATQRWTGWQELDSHPGDVPDEAAADGGAARGATAPLWVGQSDGVQARVALEGDSDGQQNAPGLASLLPAGLRLELIDPGPEPAWDPGPDSAPPSKSPSKAPSKPKGSAPAKSPAKGKGTPPKSPSKPKGGDPAKGHPAGGKTGSGGRGETDPEAGRAPEPGQAPDAETGTTSNTNSANNTGNAEDTGDTGNAEAPASAESARGGALPALSREATQTAYPAGRPYIGPRPRIVTRKGWGANEKLRESGLKYTKTVKVAFVHHTAMTNSYKCRQSPSIIRAMYRYHVKSSKWRDIGYNFLVDKCGTVYEGRAGGVAKPVMGAHTYGFNTNSTGIAVLGSYEKTKPPAAATRAVSRLAAWKLGLTGRNPKSKVWMTSGGGKFKKGKKVKLRTISGHRDGFTTECPGARLYGTLGATRTSAARMQGR